MKALQRYLPIFWLILLVGVVRFIIEPIGYGSARLFVIVGSAILWIGLLYFVRRIRPLFWLLAAVMLVPAAFLMMPGKQGDVETLRGSYLKNLRRYTGTGYVWGGENFRGIDCSGLVRQGLINANFEIGVKTLNPELLRRGISMTWHDCSAKALRDGQYDLARPVTRAGSILELDLSLLKPGDLAVTADGRHVLAYAGASRWIEADPGFGKVVELEADPDLPWFSGPAVIALKWRQLDD